MKIFKLNYLLKINIVKLNKFVKDRLNHYYLKHILQNGIRLRKQLPCLDYLQVILSDVHDLGLAT